LHTTLVGGCFVEGNWLRNAFRWKETIGRWEERPGHYGDVWNYWTDDGLAFYDFLVPTAKILLMSSDFASFDFSVTDHIFILNCSQKLAEDLGALPVWVFTAGRWCL